LLSTSTTLSIGTSIGWPIGWPIVAAHTHLARAISKSVSWSTLTHVVLLGRRTNSSTRACLTNRAGNYSHTKPLLDTISISILLCCIESSYFESSPLRHIQWHIGIQHQSHMNRLQTRHCNCLDSLPDPTSIRDGVVSTGACWLLLLLLLVHTALTWVLEPDIAIVWNRMASETSDLGEAHKVAQRIAVRDVGLAACVHYMYRSNAIDQCRTSQRDAIVLCNIPGGDHVMGILQNSHGVRLGNSNGS
jgi:hypothetical protein